MQGELLERDFYCRPTLVVARALLGCVLVRRTAGGRRASGLIVETEAYLGKRDLASHASGKNPRRARIMWGEPGHAYVYLVYGMHCCFNVVAHPAGAAGAVLVRAVWPLEGARAMERRRGKPVARKGFTDGPGKLCEALDIGISLNGSDLCRGPVLVEEGPRRRVRARRGVRVGVDYAGEWARKPWRFIEERWASGRLG